MPQGTLEKKKKSTHARIVPQKKKARVYGFTLLRSFATWCTKKKEEGFPLIWFNSFFFFFANDD